LVATETGADLKLNNESQKNLTPAKTDFSTRFLKKITWPFTFEGLNVKRQVVGEVLTLLSACFCVLLVYSLVGDVLLTCLYYY